VKSSLADRLLLGIVSDTHGLVRTELLKTLQGVDMILHAGDIGSLAALQSLQALAPVLAVRGNVDGGWASALPETAVAEVGDSLIYLLHDLQALDFDPAAAGFRAVVSGHTHEPAVFSRQGVLYLNPGSAGPRRFSLPISTVLLHVSAGNLHPEFLHLDQSPPPHRQD
jgi:putative phosphoesterase